MHLCHIGGRRSPSPVGVSREPSWLNFREASALRKQARRAWRRVTWACGLGHAAVWASQGAVPALLCCQLLGSRGDVTFEDLCVLGAAHHFGSAVCALFVRSRFGPPKSSAPRAFTAAALAALALAAAPFPDPSSDDDDDTYDDSVSMRETFADDELASVKQTRLMLFAGARFVGGFASRAAAAALPTLLDDARTGLAHLIGTTTPETTTSQDTGQQISQELVALRYAPGLGAALGFALAFLLALPVVARAPTTSRADDEDFLPADVSKILAWYAALRRSTDRVFHSSRFRPATCEQRALAARDAWRWSLGLLGGLCLVARIVLGRALRESRRFALPPAAQMPPPAAGGEGRSLRGPVSQDLDGSAGRSSLRAVSSQNKKKMKKHPLLMPSLGGASIQQRYGSGTSVTSSPQLNNAKPPTLLSLSGDSLLGADDNAPLSVPDEDDDDDDDEDEDDDDDDPPVLTDNTFEDDDDDDDVPPPPPLPPPSATPTRKSLSSGRPTRKRPRYSSGMTSMAAATLDQHSTHRPKKHHHEQFQRDGYVAATALASEASLALVHFFGCVTLQCAMKLHPKEAALLAVAAYGGAVPVGTLVGALVLTCALTTATKQRSPPGLNKKSRQQQQHQHPQPPRVHPDCAHLLLKQGTTAPFDLWPTDYEPPAVRRWQALKDAGYFDDDDDDDDHYDLRTWGSSYVTGAKPVSSVSGQKRNRGGGGLPLPQQQQLEHPPPPPIHYGTASPAMHRGPPPSPDEGPDETAEERAAKFGSVLKSSLKFYPSLDFIFYFLTWSVSCVLEVVIILVETKKI